MQKQAAAAAAPSLRKQLRNVKTVRSFFRVVSDPRHGEADWADAGNVKSALKHMTGRVLRAQKFTQENGCPPPPPRPMAPGPLALHLTTGVGETCACSLGPLCLLAYGIAHVQRQGPAVILSTYSSPSAWHGIDEHKLMTCTQSSTAVPLIPPTLHVWCVSQC